MKNKGITLIALVITIIVLLILAGITISLTIGNQGVITRAQQASKNYKDAEQQEQEELDNFDTEVDDIIIESGITKREPLSGIQPGQIAKETKKDNYVDANSDVATIPAGFTVSGIKEEQNIDSGLVIYDIPEDEVDSIDWTTQDGKKSVQEKYNQFVWIPCTATQYIDAIDDVMEKEWSCNDPYKDNGDDDYEGTTGGGQGMDWSDDYEPADIENINNKYVENGVDKATINAITSSWEKNQTTVANNSIEKYCGFYIARYEAGIPSEASFYTSASSGDLIYSRDEASEGQRGATNKAGFDVIKDLKPVAQKGVQVWNFITQPNSKIVAENMYKESDNVGSYLVDNGAWNVICNLFNGILGTNDNKRTITDSTKWGNYYDNSVTDYSKINGLWALHGWVNNTWDYATKYQIGSVNAKPNGNYINESKIGWNRIELATGLCDDFKLYNIYDMAGNVWEWTTGHNIKNKSEVDTMFVVPRGGSFSGTGNIHPVIQASGGDELTSCFCNMGFRVVLYIKK